MNQLNKLYRKCRKSDSNFIIVIIRALIIKLIYNKIILPHQNVKIKGIKNIQLKKKLEIGINYTGFMHRSDKTYLNIKGDLILKGNYSIGRGCRMDIGENAVVEIGEGGYINVNTLFIIMHKLKIGDNCAISWGCQFLDEDFHNIDYEGKKIKDNEIIIGNHVWIGSGVQIYKGAQIPDGCVVASNTIVNKVFKEKNALIGGNPAVVIKQNINWN